MHDPALKHPFLNIAELKADGEVIMCAGAIHTPHLLQLSGIGNGKDLARYDVPVRSDLPGVGENLLVSQHSLCLAPQQLSDL